MTRKITEKIITYINHPYAERILMGVSACESVFFPIPPDTMLIPMALAKPKSAFRYATLTTLASVAGGVVGYAIGLILFQTIGLYILTLYGGENAFQIFKDSYLQYGIWIVLAGALTPLPYKIITIASGSVGLNPILFIITSLIARGARFFAIALLIRYVGKPAILYMKKYFTLIVIIIFIVTFIGFFLITLV